jgi:hypothetical protein
MRSRWYTGTTTCLADDKRTVYAEAIAPTRVGKEIRSAATFAAEQFEISQDGVRQLTEEDWIRDGYMVPANWRVSSLMYRLRMDSPQVASGTRGSSMRRPSKLRATRDIRIPFPQCWLQCREP